MTATSVRYLPVLVRRYPIDAFARRSGLHPDLLHRFVALGLLDAATDPAGELWFDPADIVTVARIHRLHTELALNYAAIGLVLDLLDEIDRLHARTRGPRG